MRRANQILFSTVVVTMALLVGTAMAQQKGKRGFGGGFGFGGGGNSLVTLVGNEAVQKDLGVSGDAVSKLNSLRDDYRAAVQKEYQNAGISFQNFQNLSAEERQKQQAKTAEINAKLDEEFNPKVKELLSADQFKRLKQIQLQAGLRNQGPAALTASDVAAELKLNDEQKQKLNDLNAEFTRRQRELFTGGGFDQEAAAKLREERTSKTMAVLTAEQKEKLNTLKGSEFDVSQLGFGGGRRGKN